MARSARRPPRATVSISKPSAGRVGAVTRPLRRLRDEPEPPAPSRRAPPVPAASRPGEPQDAGAGLTHFDAAGAARMVEVGDKAETARLAVASGIITMEPATAAAIRAGQIGKGDVLAVARLAGIGGAKRTSEWIPLCHPLRLTGIDLAFEIDTRQVKIRAEVRAFDRSGVEMEALAAVSAAALTIYDMCKAIDRGMTIGEIRLEHKRGGKSGVWQRS